MGVGQKGGQAKVQEVLPGNFMVVFGTASDDDCVDGGVWDAAWARGREVSAVCALREAVVFVLFGFHEIGGKIHTRQCVDDYKGLCAEIPVSAVEYFV